MAAERRELVYPVAASNCKPGSGILMQTWQLITAIASNTLCVYGTKMLMISKHIIMFIPMPEKRARFQLVSAAMKECSISRLIFSNNERTCKIAVDADVLTAAADIETSTC